MDFPYFYNLENTNTSAKQPSYDVIKSQSPESSLHKEQMQRELHQEFVDAIKSETELSDLPPAYQECVDAIRKETEMYGAVQKELLLPIKINRYLNAFYTEIKLIPPPNAELKKQYVRDIMELLKDDQWSDNGLIELLYRQIGGGDQAKDVSTEIESLPANPSTDNAKMIFDEPQETPHSGLDEFETHYTQLITELKKN
jgi:hypothetical protein